MVRAQAKDWQAGFAPVDGRLLHPAIGTQRGGERTVTFGRVPRRRFCAMGGVQGARPVGAPDDVLLWPLLASRLKPKGCTDWLDQE